MKKLLLSALLVATILEATCQSPVLHLRYNLLGYTPQEDKVAVLFSSEKILGPFLISDASSGKKVMEGKVIRSNQTGFANFAFHYLLDFSTLKKEGNYIIQLPQHSFKSSPVRIEAASYRGTGDILLGFMRQQRCGYNPFFDQVCHQKDGKVMNGPMKDSTYRDVSGGWHDAGDQLKYLITASNATARMLMAYELFPDAFDDQVNDLGQPEPNGIPDVVDEAKWGLDWIHKLHPAKDQLIHQVGDDRDHIGWKLPTYDPSNYGWGKDSYRVAYFATGQPEGLSKYKSQSTGVSNIAGRSAAAMAMAYRIWRDQKWDESYASKCLQDAIELYDMANHQKGFQQGNSYGAPYRYNEDTWTDDMEWAATELFRATGKAEYLEDAKKYAELTGELSWIQQDTTAHYQHYPFLNAAHFALYNQSDDAFKGKLARYYRNGIEQTLLRANRNAYQNGVPFIWCSANLTVDLALQIMLYEKMTNDKQYHRYLLALRDWLLGRNPWGTSLITNLPSHADYPVDVHTSTWALTKKEVPGGLVDGPIYTKIYNSLKGLKLTHEDPYQAFQNEYVVYHDDIGDYSTNEPTMDGTACAIMLFAYFANQ